MNKDKENILELITNEEVEWKKLGEVLKSITTGLNPRKNFVLNDDSSGELTCWYITTKDYSDTEEIKFIEGKTARITKEAKEKINNRSKLEKGDLLFSAVGTVGKVAIVDIDTSNFDVNESTFVLKCDEKYLNNKYLLYLLREHKFQSQVEALLKGSTLKGIRKGSLEKIKVPIPSLKLQEKIVDILDKLTLLQAELQAELQCRTKQYEYYLEKLLTFDFEHDKASKQASKQAITLSEEYIKLLIKLSERFNVKISEKIKCMIYNISDVFMLSNGYTPSKRKQKYWDNGTIPWFRMEDIRKSGSVLYDSIQKVTEKGVKGKLFPPDSIMMATSATIGEHALVKVPYLSNQRFTNFILKDKFKKNLNMKFMYYYFYIIDEKAKQNVNDSSFPSVNMEILIKYKIPVPSIEVQNIIVEVLDKFSKYTNDANDGLLKEINLRQKEYEYYRGKLLDFRK